MNKIIARNVYIDRRVSLNCVKLRIYSIFLQLFGKKRLQNKLNVKKKEEILNKLCSKLIMRKSRYTEQPRATTA